MATAFLDSNVVAEYLRDRGPSARLFDQAVRAKLHLAINPIVLQELFAIAEVRQHPELIDALQRELTVLPVDFTTSATLLERVSGLRNRVAHSNDLLIFGSAVDCDYLVTLDRDFSAIPSDGRPKVVTPEELLKEVGVAP